MPVSWAATHALLAGLLTLAGCHYSDVRVYCPRCVVFDRHVAAPPVAAGTRALFVLVPGVLGFAWEWDEPLLVLAAARSNGVATQVYDWPPWSSLDRVAGELAARTNRLLAELPESVGDVVLVGHSAAGLITAHAAARLRVPAGVRLRIVNIGAPYAGLHANLFDTPPDALWTPLPFALGSTFRDYPPPAPGVTVESWMTAWPGDPVMMPRFGHDPGDPAVGPPGPRHTFPPGTDHNKILGTVVRDVLQRLGLDRPRRRD